MNFLKRRDGGGAWPRASYLLPYAGSTLVVFSDLLLADRRRKKIKIRESARVYKREREIEIEWVTEREKGQIFRGAVDRFGR